MKTRNYRILLSLWLFIFFVFLSDPVHSEERNWRFIGTSKTETVWYIDIDNLDRLSGDIISVWLKTVPARTDADFVEGEENTESILKKIQARSFGDYEYTLGLWEMDCSKTVFRILYFAAYGKQDEVVASSLTTDAEWSSIVPGSVSETMYDRLCVHPGNENSLPQGGTEHKNRR